MKNKLKLKIGESYHDSLLNKTMYYMGEIFADEYMKSFPVISKDVLDLVEVSTSFHKFKCVVGIVLYSNIQLDNLTHIKSY